jgi:hypothetical protein
VDLHGKHSAMSWWLVPNVSAADSACWRRAGHRPGGPFLLVPQAKMAHGVASFALEKQAAGMFANSYCRGGPLVANLVETLGKGAEIRRCRDPT